MWLVFDLCYWILVGVPVLGLSLLCVSIPVGHISLVSDFSVAVSLDIVLVITIIVSAFVLIITVDVHGS